MIANDISQLAGMIQQARQIVVFTGAGISTESGIADYRSKGGVWDRFHPVTIQEFEMSQEKRKEYWRTKLELMESFKRALPNEAHKAIVALEKMGKLNGLITQNIDGLHEMAGSSEGKMIRLHGTNHEIICLFCKALSPWKEAYERLKNGEEVPLCKKCGGFLKPNTISFGQMLDQVLLKKAFRWAGECDLLLAVGSTLVVEPAASIPRIAKEQGAALVIITLSETPFDSWAELKVAASCGAVLKQAMDMLPRFNEF